MSSPDTAVLLLQGLGVGVGIQDPDLSRPGCPEPGHRGVGINFRGAVLLADAALSDVMAAGKPLDLQVQKISGSVQNARKLLVFTQDAATPRP